VITYEWRDDYAIEFDYVSRGEAWIDPATGHLQRIVHLIDRPDQDPYPARTFTIRASKIVPAGTSPEGAYEIEGDDRTSVIRHVSASPVTRQR
jgi:hypothetical protein